MAAAVTGEQGAGGSGRGRTVEEKRVMEQTEKKNKNQKHE